MKKIEFSNIQANLETYNKSHWDVVIVGAGPSGSTTAYYLKKHNLDVLLIDKFNFPRSKICGDGLIADSINSLRKMGILNLVKKYGHTMAATEVYSPSRYKIKIPGEFMTIKREYLDYLIAQTATQCGVNFIKNEVSDLEVEKERVTITIKGFENKISAKFVIVATGADVKLAEKFGLITRRKASAIALRGYYTSDIEITSMIASYDKSIIPGYAWIFPLGNKEYNIGCGAFMRNSVTFNFNLNFMLKKFLDEFDPISDFVKSLKQISVIKGARLRCGLKGIIPNYKNKIIFTGETIGATFPFTGEGIGKAMETGELAATLVAKAIIEKNELVLQDYDKLLHKKFDPIFHGYNIAENWLSIPWLNDFVMKRTQKSRYLHNAVSGIITETVDPRDVFSIKGILKSFRA